MLFAKKFAFFVRFVHFCHKCPPTFGGMDGKKAYLLRSFSFFYRKGLDKTEKKWYTDAGSTKSVLRKGNREYGKKSIGI